MDDNLFVDEGEVLAPLALGPPWVILVVDDDEGVHEVTELILSDFSFEGRGLSLLHAFSAQEALAVLTQRDDIAVILLDVVMETDTAGLDLANRIRGELNNQQVRIVIRTGQASDLSELEVLRAYDVNDYRNKTELTMQKLTGTCLIALRNFRDIQSANSTLAVA